MTASSTLEAKLRGRAPSKVPAKAAEKILGLEPESEEQEAKLANAVHWTYGTTWGAARGLMAAAGIRGPWASAAHFLAVWTTQLVMLPAMNLTKPATEQEPAETAIDAFHHAVYALATGLVYDFLDGPDSDASDESDV